MTDTMVADTGTMRNFQRTLPSRLRAVAIHLGLSAVAFAVALYLILVHWYPGFHFTVDGGWQGVRIMAAVDLVLGPMLTLIIFNPRKARKLIVFDLTCIGLTQIGALIWGFYAIEGQHPVSVNYADGEFHSMTAAPFEIEKLDEGVLRELSDRRPALVYVRPPANEEEQARVGLQELVGGVAAWEDPLFFEKLAPRWPQVEKRAVSAERRSKDSPPFAADLPEFVQRHGGQAADYRFFPYTGRYGQCTVAFTAAGDLVDALGCEKI
jgi:hypothetical protein